MTLGEDGTACGRFHTGRTQVPVLHHQGQEGWKVQRGTLGALDNPWWWLIDHNAQRAIEMYRYWGVIGVAWLVPLEKKSGEQKAEARHPNKNL